MIYAPLNAALYHITCHELQPLVEVRGELHVRPVEIPDERLERVQLPEQVLRGGTAIAGNIQNKDPCGLQH